MKITERGTRWEITHSLWIIWSFIILVNGVGMFLAGKKTRVQKWYRLGLIYTAIGWITLIIGSEVKDKSIIDDIMMFTFFGTYVACIAQSFSIRKEYLMRLEMIEKQKTEQVIANNLKEKIAKEYGINSNREENNDKEAKIYNTENNSVKNDVLESKNEEILETSRTEKLIDVNSCTEDELLQLPGIGVIEAKKAINFGNNNEFNSVDEFIQVLNIKPHFAEKIRPMLICNKTKKSESINNSNVNTGRAGRMVDF